MSKSDRLPQQAHALLSYYSKLYKVTYGKNPRMNRFKQKWGMSDVIESVGYDRAKELLIYYFTIKNGNMHDLNFFYSNFDKMDRNEQAARKDREARKIIMQETEARVRESQNQ